MGHVEGNGYARDALRAKTSRRRASNADGTRFCASPAPRYSRLDALFQGTAVDLTPRSQIRQSSNSSSGSRAHGGSPVDSHSFSLRFVRLCVSVKSYDVELTRSSDEATEQSAIFKPTTSSRCSAEPWTILSTNGKPSRSKTCQIEGFCRMSLVHTRDALHHVPKRRPSAPATIKVRTVAAICASLILVRCCARHTATGQQIPRSRSLLSGSLPRH